MRLAGWLAGRLTGAAAGRALAPAGAWDLLRTNQVRMLDLRTGMERSRYGWPPGARPVSLLRHAVSPDRSAVYLCQHAVRSKLPAALGAREVAGGFVAWQHAGLPVARRGEPPSTGRAGASQPATAPRGITRGARRPSWARTGRAGTLRVDAPGSARWFDYGMAVVDWLVASPQRRWVAERMAGRVLEIGAGTGRNPAPPAGGCLAGVDLDLGRLRYARARSGASAPLVPVVADMARLPFADSSFDTVVSTFTYCEADDPAAALAEFRRVLRPGGRLLMLEHVAARPWPLRAAQFLLESVTAPVLGEHFTRAPLAALPGSGFTVGEHHERLGGIIQVIDARRRDQAPPAGGSVQSAG
jgi:SAM-dependent methyltransferase/rhodanese-related sulfurtransferase